MSEFQIKLADESDRYRVTVVRAVKPTWRDCWAILRGTYEPRVERHRVITVAGANRVIKDVWNEDMSWAINQTSILDFFDEP